MYNSRYNPMLLADFYKISHREQYPNGTEIIYSTWTPRMSRMPNVDKVVTFGIQAMVLELIKDYFDVNFFKADKENILKDYIRTIKFTLGVQNPPTKHIEDLHDLGYLPIKIMAVKEGTKVPLKCPMMTIENTLPEFFWLTNYLETIMSNYLWKATTSATIALEYRKILEKYALLTVGNTDFVDFQGHDFSMRGMAGLESAISSGAGHLTSFKGTDTIPAIAFLETFYFADIEKELVGCSIPATEHSVSMVSSEGTEGELELIKHLLTNVYPTGFLSLVSDTWDLFKLITLYLPQVKDLILSRDGKLVIRPDSGDPADIICGIECSNGIRIPEEKGVIELLWEIFGGTINEKGYKVLDSHIGAIYGDAITLDRCEDICRRLEKKGFASSNIVFGIGSYTYNCNTRDQFGFALKSTYAVINGKEKMIFKNPKTDKDNFKKSQTGKVVVLKDEQGNIYYKDKLLQADFDKLKSENIMMTAFEDGKINFSYLSSLQEVREEIKK